MGSFNISIIKYKKRKKINVKICRMVKIMENSYLNTVNLIKIKWKMTFIKNKNISVLTISIS